MLFKRSFRLYQYAMLNKDMDRASKSIFKQIGQNSIYRNWRMYEHDDFVKNLKPLTCQKEISHRYKMIELINSSNINTDLHRYLYRILQYTKGEYVDYIKATINLYFLFEVLKQHHITDEHLFNQTIYERISEIIASYKNISIFDYHIEQINLEHAYEVTGENETFLQSLNNWMDKLILYSALANFSKEYNCTKPELKSNSGLNISSIRNIFVQNYQPTNIQVKRGVILFGENAGGKSCLVNAIAHSVLLAQLGCFVPCKSFQFTPYKNIYGIFYKEDNVGDGLSHFTNEMKIINKILKETDSDCIVLGDEICHNTEVHSGTCITAATLDLLAKRKTNYLITTHYHNVARLLRRQKYGKIMNMNKYQLSKGSGPPFYGINVAKNLECEEDFIKQIEGYHCKLSKIK